MPRSTAAAGSAARNPESVVGHDDVDIGDECCGVARPRIAKSFAAARGHELFARRIDQDSGDRDRGAIDALDLACIHPIARESGEEAGAGVVGANRAGEARFNRQAENTAIAALAAQPPAVAPMWRPAPSRPAVGSARP